MTTLNRRVRRVTSKLYRGRPLVVDLTPLGMYVREQGRRVSSAVYVSYDVIFELGLKLQVREKRGKR